ncbi:MAG TPA: fatty acid desaturase [Rhodopila sp.]|uniref:fatty acid desaturase n=1 Tax=Rhodopila sp. TaxID=2480087 RepID=UPI002B6CAF36|nr:fatty acid desaturase [Rhodopila sp.]HVY13888.1 fatty acid desaturase [Rhodopila sp.]
MAELSERVLTIAELRSLQGRSNLRGGVRLGIHLALLAGAGWLVAIASGPATILAVFGLGLVQVALFAPAHETMHQTAFASRRANAVVGWLTSCPSLLNWHFYTAYHLAHHRHTQVLGLDPELAGPSPATRGQYVARVLGVVFWRLRLGVLWDCLRGDLSRYPYVSQAAAPVIIRSGRAMAAVMVGGSVASAWLFGWTTPFLFWIGPQLLGQPPLRAYLLAEHTGCTQDRNGLTNTRTTLTWAPVRLLMWDMPYHAEHHLFPSIPFHRLKDAHAMIRDRLAYLQPGYLRWNAAFVRSLPRDGAGA